MHFKLYFQIPGGGGCLKIKLINICSILFRDVFTLERKFEIIFQIAFLETLLYKIIK